MRNSECRQHLESLSAWLDGELSEQEAHALEAHLEVCPSCGLEADSLRRSSEAIEEVLRPMALEGHLWRRIESEIKQTAKTPLRFPVLVRRWAPLAAAAALALAIGASLYTGAGSQAPPRDQEVVEGLNRFYETRLRDEQESLVRPVAIPLSEAANPFREESLALDPESNPFAAE